MTKVIMDGGSHSIPSSFFLFMDEGRLGRGSSVTQKAIGDKERDQVAGRAPAYDLVNLAGEGELVTSLRSGNLDLFNATLESLPSQFFDSDTSHGWCWDVTKRGAIGETPLHLCFLLNTPLHDQVAEKMLNRFPNLVKDVYMGDEYYGESCLHFAVVNNSPSQTKMVLDARGNVHARATGQFFQQGGLCDYGEYPLSFAAYLGYRGIARMLLDADADVNARDSFGRTALHMAVLGEKPQLYDLLIEFGADPTIQDLRGRTPFKMAMSLAISPMINHILEHEKIITWRYGRVQCNGYPLEEVDSIDEDGHMVKNSGLELLLRRTTADHLKEAAGFTSVVMGKKWDHVIRSTLIWDLSFQLVQLSLFVTAVVLRESADTNLRVSGDDSHTNKGRLAIEFLVVVMAAFNSLLSLYPVVSYGVKDWILWHLFAPEHFLFVLGNLLLLLAVPLRLLPASRSDSEVRNLTEAEDAVVAVAGCFLFIHLSWYMRSSKILGPFAIMVYRMLYTDILRFALIYGLLVIGPGCAFTILFRNTSVSTYDNPARSVLQLFLNLLDGSDFDTMNFANAPGVAKTILVGYIIVVFILLLNLLIAKMGATYAEIAETADQQWQRQWYLIALTIERERTTSAVRAAGRRKYAQYVNGRWRIMIQQVLPDPGTEVEESPRAWGTSFRGNVPSLLAREKIRTDKGEKRKSKGLLSRSRTLFSRRTTQQPSRNSQHDLLELGRPGK